jgi:MraZ protein
VFSGRFEHAIDPKGRTSLPSRFREVLAGADDGRVVMTTAFDPYIVVYPLSEWRAFQDRLAQHSQFDEQVEMLRRVYVSGAVECEVDKLGRVLVPQPLREHAHLEREVIWAAMGKRIELWDKARHIAMREGILGDPTKRQAMMQRLAELGL